MERHANLTFISSGLSVNADFAKAQDHAASGDWDACREAIVASLIMKGPGGVDIDDLNQAFELLLNCAHHQPTEVSYPQQLISLCRELQRQGRSDAAMHQARRVVALLKKEDRPESSDWKNFQDLLSYQVEIVNAEPYVFDLCSIEQMLNWTVFETNKAWIASAMRRAFGGLTSLSLMDLFGYFTACQRDSHQAISFEDIHQQKRGMVPTSNQEDVNIAMMSQPLFWLNTIKHQSYSLSIDDQQGIRRLRPIGTFFYAKDLGGALGFVFLIGNTIIIPLYSGMVNWLEGIVVVDAATKKIGYILNKYTGLATRIVPELQAILGQFLLTASQQIGGQEGNLSAQPWTLIGERINFGHAVINDSACLAVLDHLSRVSGSFQLMLGKHDYLATIEMLSRHGTDVINAASDWDVIDNYKTEHDNLFYFPGMVVCPITTSRPVSRALDLVYSGRPVDPVRTVEKQCFFVQFDCRDGSRKCLNHTSILETTAAIANQMGHRYLVLDGLTSVPAYTKDQEQLAVSWSDQTLPQELRELAQNIAQSHRLQLVCIDGLSIPDKLEMTRDLEIIKAIAPYGSGSATPIYLLNVDTGLLGSEWYLDVREDWSWHVTRFCHSYRDLRETYVESTTWSEYGYLVSTISLSEFLRSVTT